MSVNRRDFLRYQLPGGIFILTGLGLVRPGGVLAADNPDLVVVQGKPGPACRAAVETLGGMASYVRSGDRVVIKPNMSFDSRPEAGSNTHPEVIRSLVLMCREAGAAEISVVDNPLRQAELCLEASGMKQAEEGVKQCRVEQLDAPADFSEVPVPSGLQLTRTEVMQKVLDADVLISAPTAKHHSSSGVSLGLKGMMGLILNRGIFHYRYDLHTSIVDLCTLLKPSLTVIDANWVLTTNGPAGPGEVLRAGTVVASTDPVAADAQVVSMFQWYGRSIQPRQVKHIRLAHERGLGRMDLENLQIKTIRL